MFSENISKLISEVLSKTCRNYFQESHNDITFPEGLDIFVQLTREQANGDLTTNVAMRLASIVKRPPFEIAGIIADRLTEDLKQETVGEFISKIEPKGGFINFWLSDKFFASLLEAINNIKEKYGGSELGKGQHINLEFVSANPTGPLTIAHGRQAAIGDALSRILRFAGFKVTAEYYLNDCGRQINLLGESVKIRYKHLFGVKDEMPEDGYQGEYIGFIAEEIKEKVKDSKLDDTDENTAFFRKYAVDHIMKLINTDLADFGVKFDIWTPQSDIEKKNEVEKVLDVLEKKEYIYESEGAKWFASSRLGDDKDRVVVKSDGSFTYLAPDIAYHLNKYERGFTKLVDLLGPDHHGYIRRMKAAAQALGHEKDSLEILIVQLVTLFRGGETVSMSTRKGEFVSLRELIDELGKDVTRFFFLSRRLDSHLDFDIELAKRESAENPVYYIQYAHARICSIQKFGEEKQIDIKKALKAIKLLETDAEKKLIRKLGEFPYVVVSCAEALEPNKIILYLNELARLFHSFYTECRVVSDDAELTNVRLFLVNCVKIVLANGLCLLNITMPEKM